MLCRGQPRGQPSVCTLVWASTRASLLLSDGRRWLQKCVRVHSACLQLRPGWPGATMVRGFGEGAYSTRPWNKGRAHSMVCSAVIVVPFSKSLSRQIAACTPRWSSVILYCAHYSHMAQQYGRAWHSQACDRLFDTPLWQLVRRQAEPLRLLEASLAVEWTRLRAARWKRDSGPITWQGIAPKEHLHTN